MLSQNLTYDPFLPYDAQAADGVILVRRGSEAKTRLHLLHNQRSSSNGSTPWPISPRWSHGASTSGSPLKAFGGVFCSNLRGDK